MSGLNPAGQQLFAVRQIAKFSCSPLHIVVAPSDCGRILHDLSAESRADSSSLVNGYYAH
jgi:hypothetical protein